MKKTTTKKVKKTPNNQDKRLKEIDEELEKELEKLKKKRDNRTCIPFLGVRTTPAIVDKIFDNLRTKYTDCDGRLDVIIDSPGGDIHSAYNLATLFRDYGSKELNFIVPRSAKSAATLLVCAGDNILMTPVAELGPIDPQITVMNPLENRVERFSPVAIESTLGLIRKEFADGNKQLAKGLMERLQFPLTLGTFSKSLEVAEQYLVSLLKTRKLLGSKNRAIDAKKIAKHLSRDFSGHGVCIGINEVKDLGLNVTKLEGDELNIVWKIHKLNREKQNIRKKMEKKSLEGMMKGLPPGILEKLPPSVKDKITSGLSNIIKEEK